MTIPAADNLFLQNKYSKYYYSIIDFAKTRELDQLVYVEKHHIIPKSIGGTNGKDNIVRLTAREHYICHKLLVLMLPIGTFRRKMIMARFRMSHISKNNQRYVVSSKEYEKLKIEFVKALSEEKKGKPQPPKSLETRIKMSISRKGRKHSDASKEKMRQAAIGRCHSDATKAKFATRPNNRTGVILSDATKEKMRQSALGRKHSDAAKEKMRQSAKNRKPSANISIGEFHHE